MYACHPFNTPTQAPAEHTICTFSTDTHMHNSSFAVHIKSDMLRPLQHIESSLAA